VPPALPFDPRDADDVLGAPDPFTALLRDVANLRVDDAAAARARARWLVRQAEEEGTLAGVLVDLAERGERAAVTTATGRRHTGIVRALGADFVALRDRGRVVLVALGAVTAVRTPPGAPAVSGDRAVRVQRRLLDVLSGLASDRLDVVVGTLGDEVRGRLRAVGRDVVTVRVEGTEPTLVYVPGAAITDVRIS
jgi:hypothetical protein